MKPNEPELVLEVFRQVADAIENKVSLGVSWSTTKGHEGQYQGDVDADLVGTSVLERYGYRVFSEESGFSVSGSNSSGDEVVVVIDPVDGSTNASRGIPFYSVSLCAIIDDMPTVALVRNLASGDTYTAVANNGSFKNGDPIQPSSCSEISEAIIGINGYSPRYLGWSQYRAFGSAALELCMVADGSLDGFIDVSSDALASWDVLGGVLICMESGANVLGADGSRYLLEGLRSRSRIAAAGTRQLANELVLRAWTD